MIPATHIVEFGHDPELLQTRDWVLQTRGYRVQSTTRLSDLHGMLREGRVALLILCHSLPWHVCQIAQEMAAAQTPPVTCLVLAAGPSACPTTNATVVVATADGPTTLLTAVANLVDNRMHHQPHIEPLGGLPWHS